MNQVSIIGAGASGCMLACCLAELGVTGIHVYEKSDRILRKVAATGNGRCNFTNEFIHASYYTGENTGFVESVLSDFGAKEAKELFRRMGLLSRTLESGMVYPHTMLARTLCQVLENSLHHQKEITVHTETPIVRLERERTAGPYTLVDEKGNRCESTHVVLATGGAYGIGKDERSQGYSLATSLGHTLTRLHPGIVALKVKESEICRRLQGLRQQVMLTVLDEKQESKIKKEGFLTGMGTPSTRELEKLQFSGEVLFTDYGLSGLAVLKASNVCLDYLQQGKACSLAIDCYPSVKRHELRRFLRGLKTIRAEWSVKDALAGVLPEALMEEILQYLEISPETRMYRLKDEDFEAISRCIKHLCFHVTGAKKKDHGQVTCGGIRVEEIDASTLESRLRKNLFFIGEIMDVQGICGGYNLHWAWASAYRLSKVLCRRISGGRKGCFVSNEN